MEKIPKYFSNLRCEFTRPHSVQRDEFVALSCSIPGKMRMASIPYKLGARAINFDKDDAKICYEKIIRGMMKNYSQYEKIYKNSTEDLHKASKAVAKSIKLTNKEKAKIFRCWLKAQKNFFIPVVAPFAVEYTLDDQCRKLLKNRFGNRAEEIFSIISSPTKINFYQKMRLDIDKTVISKRINYTSIEKLIEKYSWYGEYSYVEPLFDEKYFQKELAKLTKEKAIEEKNHILGDVRKNIKAFVALQKKIKDPKIKIMAKVLNDYTFLRTDRVENFKLAQSRVRTLFKFIEKELNGKTKNKWTHFDIANFTNQEILDFLEKGKIPNKKEIKKRVSHNYIYYFDTEPHFIYDSKIIKEAQKIIDESEKKNQEIKGLIAFNGNVKGKVVMVSSKNDLSKVKKGMVLVAKTTMPDYTYAMRLAAGFVTEEGGITSHAAIIARELKKPCIVGTRNCTKVLKNGDMVEIDANKGVVKILKK